MTVLMLRVCAAIFAALGLVPLANLLDAGAGVPWYRLAVLEWVVRGAALFAICFVVSSALGPRVDEWSRRLRDAVMRPGPTGFACVMSAAVAVCALGLTWYCFSGRPFTSDEMAQQWHARILLAGRLFAIPEASREFFNTAPVLDSGRRWFSQYPIGGPAILAPGLAVGAAWLVNPILLGITAWHFHGFLRAIAGEACARVALILFAVSPMVLIMGASQMNHVPALTCAMIALHALARWDASSSVRDAWPVGLFIGVLATIRPLDAAALAVVIAAFQLRAAILEPRRWPSLGIQVAAGIVPVLLLLWVNARTTGAPLLFGYDALNGPEHRLGFHVDPNGEPHTPLRGLAYASGYLLRMSRYLFEWPIPGMLVVVGGMLVAPRAGKWDVLLAGLAVTFLLAYGAYWFDGFFSGPRFLFTTVPAFIYFAARLLQVLPAVARPRIRRMGLIAAPLCVLAAWAGPNGVSSARGRAALYHDQRTKLKTDVPAQVARAGLSNALVFVNEGWRGRLLARLRVLGASQFRAERIVNEYDACALGDALDDVTRLRGLPDNQRLQLVIDRARSHGQATRVSDLPADQSVALVPGSRPSATCVAQLQMDAAGTIPYPPFLPLHSLDDQGRISGSVIFARDLGEQNELLRARFGSRTWYRYRPATGLRDTANVFVPYSPTDE